MSNNFDFSVQYKVTDSGVGEVKGKGKTAASGEGGWLMAFAEAMGKLMEKQLDAITKFSQSIGTEPSPTDSTKLTAMTQMFQMFMNAVSTALKSVGEGESGMARKQ